MEMSPETLMRPLALVTGGDVSKAHYHNGSKNVLCIRISSKNTLTLGRNTFRLTAKAAREGKPGMATITM